MADIFVSYSRADQGTVAKIVAALEAEGWSVWWDTRLRAGEQWDEVIEREIRSARCVVVLWSPLSVTRYWVKVEANFGLSRGILVPLAIEGAEPPLAFTLIQAANLTGWDGDAGAPALRRAVEDVREKLRRAPGPMPENYTGPAGTGAEGNGQAQTQAERDWKLIENSTDPRDFRAFIEEHKSGLLVRKAQHRLDDFAEAERAAAAELARREEAARLEAVRQQEARYRSEGRIRADAAFVRPPGLEWFLPGAGKSEGFKDLDVAPEMVIVPATKEFFWMGSKDNEGDADERPRHKVKIPAPFAVGKYPVTVAEYMAGVKAGGCKLPEWLEKGSQYNVETGSDGHYKRLGDASKGDRFPIVGVSWDDAKAYAAWLGSKTGKAYRLLSEAEWEYACRAGTESAYSFGGDESQLDRYAWYSSKSGGRTHLVGEKLANEWGLHDMHGNVWEWCEDCWNDSYSAKPDSLKANGGAWTTGDCGRRVLRGGSWGFIPRDLRSASRGRNAADYRDDNIGFRLARTLSY